MFTQPKIRHPLQDCGTTLRCTNMIVQIYEIQDPWEAERCIELGVDHIGSVVLSTENWQNPEIRDLIKLTQNAGGKNSLIFLFWDKDIIFGALDYYCPDIIHFCESLTDEAARPLELRPFVQRQDLVRRQFPEIKIMRSISIAPRGHNPRPPAVEIAKLFEPVTDIFLTDTWLGKEPVEGYIGITGRTLDWDAASQLVKHTKLPVILAGGLSPNNVYEAVVKVVPAGADSCTETNMTDDSGRPIRFKKDFHKVKQFLSEIRRAEEELVRINRE